MKITNLALQESLDLGHTINLNLGSGLTRKEGFFNVDLLPLPSVDIVADLNEPLDLLPDDSVTAIYTSHTLEHVLNFPLLLQEIHRITLPGARIEIIVPHFSNPYAYSDPTHVRFFGLYTFFYFSKSMLDGLSRRVPTFYAFPRFRIESVFISFYRDGRLNRWLSRHLERFFNQTYTRLDLYERHFCWLYPAHEITYIVYADK